MWNNTTLKPPPTNSSPGSVNCINLPILKTSLDDLIIVIKYCSEPLLLEENMLCAVLYKFKTRLRQHIDMKFMMKIHKHLHKCNQINLIKDVTHFQSAIPNKISSTVYWPTKQMLEYVLVRIQGYSKLLAKLINLAAETAKYILNRLVLGHYWTFALAVLSVVSRIWEICHHIVEVCCTCYQNILPVRNELNLFGTKWLDGNYIFPIDLRKWLELTWTLEDLKSLTNKKLNLVTYVISDEEDDDIQFLCTYKNDCIIIDDSIKLNDNDVEFVNEYIDIIDTPRKSKFDIFKFNNKSIIDVDIDSSARCPRKDSGNELNILNSDTGEIVERDGSTLCPIIEIETSTPKRKRKNSLQESLLWNVEEMSGKRKDVCEISTNLNISKIPRQKKHRLHEDDESIISLSDSSEMSHKLSYNNKSRINLQANKNKSDLKISKHNATKTEVTPCIHKEIITTDESYIDVLPDVYDNDTICANTPKKNVVNMDTINLNNHNLQNVKSIKHFNTFLATEKLLRSKNHPSSITLNLDKNTWKKMIKMIEDIFITRKRMKQDKKLAVVLAKNIIVKHVGNTF